MVLLVNKTSLHLYFRKLYDWLIMELMRVFADNSVFGSHLKRAPTLFLFLWERMKFLLHSMRSNAEHTKFLSSLLTGTALDWWSNLAEMLMEFLANYPWDKPGTNILALPGSANKALSRNVNLPSQEHLKFLGALLEQLVTHTPYKNHHSIVVSGCHMEFASDQKPLTPRTRTCFGNMKSSSWFKSDSSRHWDVLGVITFQNNEMPFFFLLLTQRWKTSFSQGFSASEQW